MITEKKQINTSVTKKHFTKEPLAKPKPCPTGIRDRIRDERIIRGDTSRNQRMNLGIVVVPDPDQKGCTTRNLCTCYRVPYLRGSDRRRGRSRTARIAGN
jgi:hypothetical protein